MKDDKYRPFMKLRKPIPKTGGTMRSRKEYRRDREDDLKEIEEGIKEYEKEKK